MPVPLGTGIINLQAWLILDWLFGKWWEKTVFVIETGKLFWNAIWMLLIEKNSQHNAD